MDSQIKIGFDAKRLFHNDTGLGNYSRTLVKNLQQYYPDHEYHLFTPSIRKTAETEYFLDGRFHIHTADKWMPSSLWRSVSAAKLAQKLNLDIFHGLSHELPFFTSNNIISLVTFHDLIYEVYPQFFRWHDRMLYRWKYRSAAERAGHIISISEATKKDLIHHYKISELKISTIYQSVNPLFQSEPAQRERKHFLYVGTIEERKGLDHAIHAYAKLPLTHQLPFLVVGHGNEYEKKVKKTIAYYGLENKIRFMGKLENQALIELYDEAMVLLLPSVYEGFGVPIAEALFRGTPVITSPHSALPEAAGPGGIIAEPADHDALAAAMIEIQDDIKWKTWSAKGRAYADQVFSSSITAEQLNALYLQLIKINSQKVYSTHL